ncbi:MAG: hypothetical protein JSU07_13880 [Bacteroidetes bacterium]|nr:hypothetical protein [Bacteroidota bacterium]
MINKLNNDVYLYIFTFLKCKEIRNSYFVSKQFNVIAKKSYEILVKKTKEQIFYMVGNPILISSPRSIVNKAINTLFGVGYDTLYINFRKAISEAEIKKSFPSQEKIKLFTSEEEALSYSRYLRNVENPNSYDGEKIYQPAIFKVQYLGKMEDRFLKKETLLIDSHNEDDYFDGQLKIDIEYFEVDKCNIMPYSGNLKIKKGKNAELKEYEHVEYNHSCINFKK